MTEPARNARVRELTTHIGSGATPRGGASAYVTSGVPFIRSQNVLDGALDLTNVARIAPSTHIEMRRSTVMPNDVLLNITGASLGRACVVPSFLQEANVSQHVCILRTNGHVLPQYLRVVLSHERTQRRIRVLAAGGSREGLNYDQLGNLTVPIVERSVQTAIVETSELLETHLQSMRRLMEAKRSYKRGLAQQVFSGASTHAPLARLSKHTVELTGRNRFGAGRDRVMGVIKGVGLAPMRDNIRAGDLARYKDVPPDAFAYNPMRINIGSIARNTSDSACLVSPDYVVFQTDPESLLPAYLDQLRHTRLWQSHMDGAGAGGVRIRIYFRDLAEIRVPLPSLEEQRRIANLLASLDGEIATLQRLAHAYEKLRSAVLDKLLSGEIPIPAS